MGNGNNLGISLTSGIISRSEVEISFNGNINKYIIIANLAHLLNMMD